VISAFGSTFWMTASAGSAASGAALADALALAEAETLGAVLDAALALGDGDGLVVAEHAAARTAASASAVTFLNFTW
jgi:hypothetical protein